MPRFVAPVADEREGLLAYLGQQRLALRLTAYGLTDEQARATPTASSLSVGGLIKHLATVERRWTNIILRREQEWSADNHRANPWVQPWEAPASKTSLHEPWTTGETPAS
jgi:uncharacterized damage-inducible protein DinB